MVKSLKNLLLQNQLTDDFETEYIAFSMRVLARLLKLWPWVNLDPFYATVKFDHIGFCMGKSENYLFFGNYCSLRSQHCLKHSTKWVNEVEWVSKVKVILWPWSEVTQISNVWLSACILRWAIQGLRTLLLGLFWKEKITILYANKYGIS